MSYVYSNDFSAQKLYNAMKKDELEEIYNFDLCEVCHDIMPTDTEKRRVMHGEGMCDVRQAAPERATKVLQ